MTFRLTAEYYDLFYDWKDYAAEADRLEAIIRERAPRARTLLDIACGTGRHLELLAGRFEVEGADIEPAMLEVARRRLPHVRFHEADMRTLELRRTFHAVTCLFSSIGYVGTPDVLLQAMAALGRHVAPGGVLIVEPWLTPEAFDLDFLGRVMVVERPGLQAVRMNSSRVADRVSVMEFHYLIGRPGELRHFVETHELGLFTDDEYASAMGAAGLVDVEHDTDGFIGRGLWIGRRSG